MLKVLNSHPPDYHYKNITSQMAYKILNLQVITFKIEKEKKKKKFTARNFQKCGSARTKHTRYQKLET